MKIYLKSIPLLLIFIFLSACQEPPYECFSFEDYSAIDHFQSKEEIVDLLGQPDEILMNSQFDESYFSEGGKEELRDLLVNDWYEAWIYYGEENIADIYFDEAGGLNGYGCRSFN